MNIALLFNSDHPSLKGGSYDRPVKRLIFGPSIIQSSGRQMKVMLGDVSTYGKSPEVWYATYFADTWSNLLTDKLEATINVATVFSYVFENITDEIAVKLHEALLDAEAYLGFLQVDYRHGPHLALFRNSMLTKYRVQGTTCRIFFTMGENEDPDKYEAELLAELGYTDVAWEDRGAQGTIFDNYDTLEHFEQVEGFKQFMAPHLPGGEHEASELAMVLEDLNPHLFNSLGAAVLALERARHEEDVAQASVSGRRYLERLSDVLFPPRKESYKGRDVGAGKYKNRIWAFVANNVTDKDHVKNIGKEYDRLTDEFNAGVHGDRTKMAMLRSFAEAASLTLALLALNPSDTRKPYYAYQEQMLDFFKEALRNTGEQS